MIILVILILAIPTVIIKLNFNDKRLIEYFAIFSQLFVRNSKNCTRKLINNQDIFHTEKIKMNK